MDSDSEPREKPTLVHKTVGTIKQKRGHSAVKGRDILVVFSSTDLMRNLLLKSEIVQQRIPNFAKKHGILLPQEADDRVKYLLLLNTDSQSIIGMPTLERSDLNTLVSSTKLVGDEQQTAETVKESKIKTETLSNPQPKEVQKATSDWSTAYSIFFPKAALPLLEGVIAVAKFYDCEPASLAFKTLSYDWITNGSLYPAIATAPVRWLALAVELQSELVYKEAFVHVVGLHSQKKVDLDGLPEPVMTFVKERVVQERMKR
ncbi:hypothetical protein NU219Hw_g8784t2 [Hortaea werneckii]